MNQRSQWVKRIPLAAMKEAWREKDLLVGLRQQMLLGWVLRYGLAVVAIVVVFWLRIALTAWIGPGLPTYITFYPAVMAVALLAGFGPGLLATVLTGLLVAYWILPPEGFAIESPADRLGLAIFTFMGLFMSAFAELYRRRRDKAAAYDREAALREIQKQNQFLANFIQQASQPFAVGYPDGRLGLFNKAFEQLTGYSADELRQIDWATVLTPPEWLASEQARLEELNRTSQPVRYQKEYIRKDGSRVPIELLVHLARDGDGKPLYYYCFLTDITDRKLAESVLQATLQRFYVVLSSMYSGVLLVTDEGRVEFANQAICDHFGLKDAPTDLVGLDSQEMLEKIKNAYLHSDEAVVRIREILEREQPVRSEELAMRDGRTCLRDFVPLNVHGKSYGRLWLHFDITERKRAEDVFRFLVQCGVSGSGEGFFQELARYLAQTLDMEFVCIDRLEEGLLSAQTLAVFHNGQFEDNVSYTLKDTPCGNVVGQRICCFPQNVRGLFPKDVVLQDMQAESYLGTTLWSAQGKPIGLIAVIGRQPLTDTRLAESILQVVAVRAAGELERQQAEEALRQAKTAAEAANKAKSRFLANISHELRTPMNAILGMVDLASQQATDPTARDFLDTARQSADLLLALLNDLLDCAKIESGKLELESAPFSLRHILDQMTQVLSVRASEKGLAFSCRMPAGTPDALVGDQVRLRQIVYNLAGNAIKFTERGDVEVKVRANDLPSPFERGTQRVPGDEGRSKDASPTAGSLHPSPLPPNLRSVPGEGTVEMEFAVRDTGIGISQSDLEHIFQPFSQADASTTRRFGGTGLGLSICSSLVALMGGHIWVESKLGQGSTFFFTVRLPWAKELPAEPEPVSNLPAVKTSTLRILLVEDNPANQKLAAYILQDRGHTVDIAPDGQQSLKMSQENKYDVILMDVQMPGMDGMEATAAIRAREKGKGRVPIIAMTAYAMKGDRERFLAAGMDGYLSKPMNANEMIGLVETLAAGSANNAGAAIASPSTLAEPANRPAACVFDPKLALGRCFNNRKMLEEMIQFFCDEADSQFQQMRVALEKGDLAEVGRLGHHMKGTVVFLGAQPATDAASAVERFHTADGEMVEAEEAVRALESEIIALAKALASYRQTDELPAAKAPSVSPHDPK